MATSRPTSEQLKTLRNYTACDIADALVKLNVPNAGFLADLKLITPSPSRLSSEVTIAPASTVLFRPKIGTPDGFPAANIPSDQHYVDRTQPETIVVIQQPEGQICAVLGGIMALRMKVLNAKGVVVSGRVRDVVELESTGLPIWAKATSIVGTALEAKPHAVQVPLVIGGTKVTPGDLVFSDTTNGVVVIPQDRIAEVISLLPGLVEADDQVKGDVSIGMTVQEAFKTHRR
ncbi:related to dlpA protein [Rhynchosporium graminicola]|uniref:Related to dlpA protein n=1 Tax=Rhynchosporium graminicola TaxID=2792576 RepID=A0A1E1KLW3_9HELO|nr:related to dlpA protein [Rhynchosporium commune]